MNTRFNLTAGLLNGHPSIRHSDLKLRGIRVRQQHLSVQALICVLAMVSAIGRPEFATGASDGETASPSLQEVQAAIYAAIEQSEYEIGWQPSAGAYMTPNRAQNLRFTFLEDGVTIVPRERDADLDWSATVRLASIGRVSANVAAFTALSWAVDRNTGRLVGKEATIEYQNDREGLRQNFLIAQRPPGDGPLRLEFVVALDKVMMFVDQSGDSMYLAGGSSGTSVMMRYRDMTVLDANQRLLDARMEWIDSEHFAIVVNDSDAQYPILVDPLYGDGSLSSTQSGSLFGYCVASFITFDGTALGPLGIRSTGGLLVGAPYFDPGNAAQAGKIFLYDTAGGALPSTPTWSYAGTQVNEHVGWSASDGGQYGSLRSYHIILVGAPGGGLNQAGAAFAFYPNSLGQYASTPDWTVTASGAAGAHLGWSVAGGGDYNNDYYSDVLVGAPNYTVPSLPVGGGMPSSLSLPSGGYGAAFIYYGSISGFSTTPGWTVYGPANNSCFGFSVAWGHVQGPASYPAVMVGAPAARGSGAVYEYLNSTGVPNTTPDATLNTLYGDQFGYALASAQDQNSDTYDDLLVGAPNATYNSLAHAGKVYLFRGGPSGLSQNNTADWSTGGTQTNEAFGASIAFGDMNADFFADFMVGAPNHNTTSLGLTLNGAAYFFLSSSTYPYLPYFSGYRNDGICSNLKLGTSMAYAKTLVNSDADMIAGGPYADGGPCVNVQVWMWQ